MWSNLMNFCTCSSSFLKKDFQMKIYKEKIIVLFFDYVSKNTFQNYCFFSLQLMYFVKHSQRILEIEFLTINPIISYVSFK